MLAPITVVGNSKSSTEKTNPRSAKVPRDFRRLYLQRWQSSARMQCNLLQGPLQSGHDSSQVFVEDCIGFCHCSAAIWRWSSTWVMLNSHECPGTAFPVGWRGWHCFARNSLSIGTVCHKSWEFSEDPMVKQAVSVRENKEWKKREPHTNVACRQVLEDTTSESPRGAAK